jgi:hypothetical protein
VVEAAGEERGLRLVEDAKERQGGRGGRALLIYKEKLASAATMRRGAVSSFTFAHRLTFFRPRPLSLDMEQTGNGVIGAHQRNPSIAPRIK